MALQKIMLGAAFGGGVALVARQRSKSFRSYELPSAYTYIPETGISVEHVDHAQSHEDEDAADVNNKVALRRFKLPVIFGNIAIGAAEVLTGGSGALAVTTDGVHNVGDAISYAAQFEADETKNKRKIKRLRKFGHWVIASSSLMVGSKAMYDIATHADHNTHSASLFAATASVAFNGYLARGIIPVVKEHGWKRLTGAQRDIVKHFAAVDAPSSVLAVGGAIAANAGANYASSTAAVVSGAIGAYVFRPTKKNLEEPHVCASHTGHHHHSHHDTHEPITRNRLEGTPRLRRAAALLGASAMLCAGVTAASSPASHAPEANRLDRSILQDADASLQKILPSQPLAKKIRHKSNTYTVQAGDTLWNIVEDKFCSDGCINREIVEYVVDIAKKNRLTDPDYIVPTQRLDLFRV